MQYMIGDKVKVIGNNEVHTITSINQTPCGEITYDLGRWYLFKSEDLLPVEPTKRIVLETGKGIYGAPIMFIKGNNEEHRICGLPGAANVARQIHETVDKMLLVFPYDGCEFYFITFDNVNDGLGIHKGKWEAEAKLCRDAWEKGNYFPTESEAEDALAKVAEVLKATKETL